MDFRDDIEKQQQDRGKVKKNPKRDEFLEKVREEAVKKYGSGEKAQRAVKRFLKKHSVQQFLDDLENDAFLNFVPRPDDPANFDQQASFCYNRDSVSFLIGGNAAGTTEAAAYKTALFLLTQQEPPRPDTPFWILSNNYQQTCATCWQEKLLGHGHIPKQEVDWNRITWISRAKGWPERVPLKPWYKGSPNNWCIEFKSYDQGRQALQARSIGGFWFSEQFPAEIFIEVFRGCREYMFPGSMFCEFTPIDPVLCIWVEKIMENPPKGWAFYRANTQKNVANLADGWFDQFFASVSDEMLQVRMTGALATFEGVIYPSFSPSVHTCPAEDLPKGVFHFRSIDWGASAEHPFVCLWGCVDAEGNWTIYDEYWNTSQERLLTDHVKEIEERSYAWGYPKDYIHNPYYGACFADPSRPDNIATFNSEGIWIEPASNDVFNGIEAVRVLLKVNPITRKPRIRIFDHCKHLIEEMRMYRWKRSKKVADGGVLNPVAAAPTPLKRDDDTVDALRYMIYSQLLQEGGTKPFEASYKPDKKWTNAVWGG